MKNFYHKKNCNQGKVQVHVDPPPPHILLFKINVDDKLDKDCVKIKFCRDPTLERSYLYEFKIAFFDSDDPEEFLLFINNFNITLEASGTIVLGTNIQYFSMLKR